jgi:protein-S-isoprenylcysteine O-methyltransferase Ste14
MTLYATGAELLELRRFESRSRIFLSLSSALLGVSIGQLLGLLLSGYGFCRVVLILLSLSASGISYWQWRIARKRIRVIIDCIRSRPPTIGE